MQVGKQNERQTFRKEGREEMIVRQVVTLRKNRGPRVKDWQAEG
jgi:hypothetical protein